MRFSPDGSLLASASADATVRLHDARTGALYAVLRGHAHGVSDVAWAADSATVATASDDQTVMLWDVATATLLRILRGHSNYVFCVAFNGASNLLLSGSFDETIRVWDVRTGVCIKTLPAHSDPVSSVGFSKDGTLIVSSSYDGLVRLWDADSGQCLKTLVGADNPPVGSAVFSPNGTYVLVATLDSKVRLWEYGSAKVVKTYAGGCDERYCMPAVFVPPPRRGPAAAAVTPHVVSGSEAGAPVVWDGHTKGVVQRLAAHTDAVLAVTAHPVRPVIATGGLANDRTVRVWVHEDDDGDEPAVVAIPRVPPPPPHLCSCASRVRPPRHWHCFAACRLVRDAAVWAPALLPADWWRRRPARPLPVRPVGTPAAVATAGSRHPAGRPPRRRAAWTPRPRGEREAEGGTGTAGRGGGEGAAGRSPRRV